MLTQTCIVSGQEFTIPDRDLEYYNMMGIDPPKICPDERARRRYAWRNECELHRRTCSGTGEKTLSVYPADVPFPVYTPEYWYSDHWNALDYGRDFDFSRPFFPQFQELMHSVPQLARSVVQNQNCEYINQAGWCKDCYLIFEADYNELCMYSWHIGDSRSCLDCLYVLNCELCYECIDCNDCYDLRFSQNSRNCNTSWFLKNCIGCNDSFGCVNLRNKQYYFMNQKCTKEEYEQKLAQVNLHTFEGLQKMREQFSELAKKFPCKHMEGTQNEDSTGDYLYNTQRCRDCYNVTQAQDCAYVVESRNLKNVYDLTVFGAQAGVEFCCDNHEVGEGVRNTCFSDQIWSGCYDIWYSKMCVNNSHHLFGCASMQKASYCIFNKQYSPEEYEKLKNKIIAHMKETGEFGQFFPIELSPFPYNETLAQDYFPMSKEEVEAKGWKWRDPPTPLQGYGGQGEWQEEPKIPEKIADVDDSILQQVLTCQVTGKPYKIQKAELAFYRKNNLPLPLVCYRERHHRRFGMRSSRHLFSRVCGDCGKAIETPYSEDRPERILCESCYLKVVD